MADRLTQIIMQKASWSEQKEQKRRQRRRAVMSFIGLTALVLLFAYMFVWQRVYTLQLAEEHSHRKANVSLLKEKCQSLQFEVEYLASLENIEALARGQMAMMPAREAQFAKAIQPPAETKTKLQTEEAPAVAKTDPASKTPAKKTTTSSHRESNLKLAMLNEQTTTARSDAGPKPAVLKNNSVAPKSASNSKAVTVKKNASTSKKQPVNKTTKPAAKKTGAKGKGAGKTGA